MRILSRMSLDSVWDHWASYAMGILKDGASTNTFHRTSAAQKGQVRTLLSLEEVPFKIACLYEAASGLTQGIVVLPNDYGLNHLSSAVECFVSCAGDMCFSDLISALMADILIECKLRKFWMNIDQVEQRTGYHTWMRLPVISSAGSLAEISASTSGVAVVSADCKKMNRLRDGFLDLGNGHGVSQYNLANKSALPYERPLLVQRSCANTDAARGLELLRQQIHMQSLNLEYLSARAQTQLQAVSTILKPNKKTRLIGAAL